jgi:flagellar protein FlaJ
MNRFQIPFTLADIEIQKRKSKRFIKFASAKKTKLDEYLKAANVNLNKREYLAICYRRFLINIISFSVIASSVLGILRTSLFPVYGFIISLLISGLVYFNQINYPKVYTLNKQRDVDKNLIPVLQDMIVQLNSGVPIFRILSNISESDYGEVSVEFKKIVKEINSGVSQIDAIEKHAKLNTSEYFKRVLWQISNGMRAGSDMEIVIKEGIKNLSDEQAIQIQTYGNRLNPLIMFYMLIAVIIPALGITFLIILASLLGFPEKVIHLIFVVIFVIVVFMQIMFLGLVKSRRPSLL